MPQFFVHSEDISGTRCLIRGSDARHLRLVRRVAEGHELLLRDEAGVMYRARVVSLGEDVIEAEITGREETAGEPLELVLCAALIKGGRFDLVIQKAVELGVSRIIPVLTERTVSRPGAGDGKKSARWNRIAAEAAKQSMRRSVPAVDEPLSLDELVERGIEGTGIIAHTGASPGFREYLSGAARPASVHLLVGPEGGFTPGEVEKAAARGWVPLRFGFTQLRAETAAIVLPALLLYEWNEEDEDTTERERG